MSGKHAILSASSSARWLKCPPSAMLNAAVADTTSEYVQQGTDAHTLCEYKLKKCLGMCAQDPTVHLEYYDAEMEECSDAYVNYILEQKAEVEEHCKDPLVLIEQKLDFSRFVPNGFGTGDCVIVADQELTVIDFKYGVGVEVSAVENTQMMLYGLGALLLFDGIYDIETITMTIYQPRKDNISTWQISKEDLYDWAVNVLNPTAELAAEGKGEFQAGSHCRFCKVKAQCRKRAEYNLELAKYDFAPSPELEDIEIEAVLAKADQLVSWVGDVKDYALQKALQGKKWNDWKLVEGRSNRKYKNEDEAAKAVEAAGFDPYNRKILGITEMTKLLGKEKFNDILKDQIIKPKGKPTLVGRNDRRKEIAVSDFEGED